MTSGNTFQPDAEFVGLGWITTRLQIGLPTVRAAIRRGELPAYRFGKRHIRVRKSDVEAWATRIEPRSPEALLADDSSDEAVADREVKA